ncbi:hypothetical protein BK133_24690 [Paenibacillus sp. FSL H8-0548]|uniref:cache domain-containing sensor histidine kinase n=1 Tax=Paenibacillus sp. FSL H8-0548 TaxID=1920422 RepID=UPI00096C49EA|nr:sensor histidine kinase [Paenibacillus sp. FSL H8-0548]OMF23248.1 hypothetical protein BK133_24690 [Paenibacillus sp. FSL H8-0548]
MPNRIRLWSDLSVQYKLFAAILFAVSIPFILLLSIHLNISASESREQASYSADKVMAETRSFLEYKAESIHEMLNFIAFNEVIQNQASKTAAYEDVNVWAMDANRIDRVLNQFPHNQDIESIRLYLQAGLAGEDGNSDFLLIDQILNKDWLEQFKQSKQSFTWISSELLGQDSDAGQITILRKIPEEHNILSYSGLVSAQISKASIQKVLDHSILTPNTTAFLINNQGELLSASSSSQMNVMELSEILNSVPSLMSDEYGWVEHVVFQDHTMLIGATAIQNKAMKLIVVVPESDILATIYKTRNQLISIFLIIIPFILPLSFVVAGSSTKKLRQLIRHMRKVRDGDFSKMPIRANRDEVGDLIVTYNSMVNSIGRLMDETYQLGQEVKNKELKALQAQINPHFLYNTLDLINIMAIESEEDDISTVVGELAVFYKLSLSDGLEKIMLANEIKHVEAYMRIQNMRFGGGIKLEVEASDELLGCEVPKIILQPLVENAILHGIREKDSEEGTITIGIFAEEGCLIIRIRDDGVGMSEKQLASAIAGKSSKRTGGFGVRNIQERISLLFGHGYGLAYESKLGVGTMVTVKLPIDKRA